MAWDDEGESQVLRRQNRALRSANKSLRKAQQKAQHKMDELFMHMCETPTEAEQALWRLWEECKLTCSPEDYITVVDTILERLEANKPTQSESAHELFKFVYQGNVENGGLPNQ